MFNINNDFNFLEIFNYNYNVFPPPHLFFLSVPCFHTLSKTIYFRLFHHLNSPQFIPNTLMFNL